MEKKNCKITFNISLIFFVLFSLVDADWEPDVRLTNDPNRSYVASIKNARCVAASEDTVHAVWYDDRDGNWEIYYKRSTDAGTDWSSDIRLTNDPDSSQFAAIATSGSYVHVAWHDHRDGNWEIYYKRSTDGGSNWELDKRLTDELMNSYHPTIAAFDSLVFILWNDWRERQWEIYYMRSTDNGANWSSDKRLSDTIYYSAYPSVAISDSNVHAVWVDERDGNAEIYHKHSADAGLNWTADKRLTNEPELSWFPSVAAAGSKVHVAWNDFRHLNMEIYYKRSTDNGITWSSDIRFTNDPNFSGYTALAASGSNVHLVWYDIPVNSEIYYKRSTDNGENWSANTRLTNAIFSSLYASVTTAGPYVHVLWQDSRDNNFEIYYKRDSTGNAGLSGESAIKSVKSSQLCATMVRNVLNLCPNSSAVLIDIKGRKVQNLKPGKNDVRHLPTGVYFLQVDNRIRREKIVIFK